MLFESIFHSFISDLRYKFIAGRWKEGECGANKSCWCDFGVRYGVDDDDDESNLIFVCSSAIFHGNWFLFLCSTFSPSKSVGKKCFYVLIEIKKNNSIKIVSTLWLQKASKVIYRKHHSNQFLNWSAIKKHFWLSQKYSISH